MEDNPIFDQISNLIRKNRGELSKAITYATTLQKDLGIDGADAEEVLIEYFSMFGIDTSNFNFPDYFGEESFNLIEAVKTLFSSKKKKPITVGHSVNCAVKRKWTIP